LLYFFERLSRLDVQRLQLRTVVPVLPVHKCMQDTKQYDLIFVIYFHKQVVFKRPGIKLIVRVLGGVFARRMELKIATKNNEAAFAQKLRFENQTQTLNNHFVKQCKLSSFINLCELNVLSLKKVCMFGPLFCVRKRPFLQITEFFFVYLTRRCYFILNYFELPFLSNSR